MAMTHRNGKELKVLQDGHPRRLADGRNAWKKMDQAQRETFLREVIVVSSRKNRFMIRLVD